MKTTYNISMVFGEDDINSVDVVFSQAITESDFRAWEEQFKGLFFNDNSGTYWTFDRNINGKDFIFDKFEDNKIFIKVYY